ncbi:hypothetical protein DIPPA_12815 [Diplonema papillatum]|nr:hypothetical protein DIPPA_12815 [Diplonema papillatum]
MRDHDDALLVGTEVELAEGTPASRGWVIEARTDREYVAIAGGAVLTLQRHELTPEPGSHCGTALHQLRLLMERQEGEERASGRPRHVPNPVAMKVREHESKSVSLRS